MLSSIYYSLSEIYDLNMPTLRGVAESFVFAIGRNSGGVKSYIGDVEFDVLCSGSGEYDRLELIEESKELMFPLGMVFGQWFLYVGRSHKIYMSDVKNLYLLGENIEEFLNNIILIGNKPVEI